MSISRLLRMGEKRKEMHAVECIENKKGNTILYSDKRSLVVESGVSRSFEIGLGKARETE